jgi:hypothetical protein
MRRTTVIRSEVTAKMIRERGLFVHDFVNVPTITTRGVWKLVDCVPPEQLALLAQWTNKREKQLSKIRGMVRR